MPARRQYGVLGPLPSVLDTRGFLGCEMRAGAPVRDGTVVVVWLAKEHVEDRKLLARLLRETAFVKRLEHPNLLRVHGVECFEENWARIVEYADAEPLRAFQKAAAAIGASFSAGMSARIVLDLAAGVMHAHERGEQETANRPIVHGGIRPDTAFVSFSGVAKLSGLGAWTIAPEGAKSPYLSPEQMIGGRGAASVASDIYALGAILYELLAGRPPFDGEEDLETAVMTKSPAPLELEGLAGRLAEIAAKAMARKSADRYPNARTIVQAIEDAADEDGLVSAEELKVFLDDLIPFDASERAGRADLHAAASDPEAITVLSFAKPPEDVDAELLAAARPSEVEAAPAPEPPPKEAEPPKEVEEPEPPTSAAPALAVRIREALPREAATVIADSPPSSRPSIASTEGEDEEPMERSETVRANRPSAKPAPAATLEEDEPEPPPAKPAPRPSEEARKRSGPKKQSVVTLGPSLAQEETHRIPGRRSSGDMEVADLELTPAAIPRAPIREDSVTAFKKNVGDSSRATLALVLAGGAAVLFAIFYFGKPAPPELLEEASRHNLPKEALEVAFTNPPQNPVTESPIPELVAPGTPDGSVPSENAPKLGMIVISTRPPVQVFLRQGGKERDLGRVPVQQEVPAGRYEVRFTDKDRRINVYKEYVIAPGAFLKEDLEFVESKLTVNAPAGASVYLNEQLVGPAPLSNFPIYEGRYHVKVTQDTKKWAEWVEVAGGRNVKLDVKL